MPTATLTSKGQVTVPKAVREALHAEAGDVLDFTLRGDGSVEVRKLGGRVRDLAGFGYRADLPPGPDVATLTDETGEAFADDDARIRDQRR